MTRLCAVCPMQLVQRPDESPKDFAKRRTCCPECGSRLSGETRNGAVPLEDPDRVARAFAGRRLGRLALAPEAPWRGGAETHVPGMSSAAWASEG